MKKSRIHGEIRDKFIIKDTKTNLIVQEKVSEDIETYPAIFNSEDDAKKYLENFELSEEEKENIKIECTDISFFHHGGILVEMNVDKTL